MADVQPKIVILLFGFGIISQSFSFILKTFQSPLRHADLKQDKARPIYVVMIFAELFIKYDKFMFLRGSVAMFVFSNHGRTVLFLSWT